MITFLFILFTVSIYSIYIGRVSFIQSIMLSQNLCSCFLILLFGIYVSIFEGICELQTTSGNSLQYMFIRVRSFRKHPSSVTHHTPTHPWSHQPSCSLEFGYSFLKVVVDYFLWAWNFLHPSENLSLKFDSSSLYSFPNSTPGCLFMRSLFNLPLNASVGFS